AALLLGAFDRTFGHGVLRGRPFPALEGRLVCRLAEGPDAGAAAARRRKGGEGGAHAEGRARANPRRTCRARRPRLSADGRKPGRARPAGALMARLSAEEKSFYAREGYVVPGWRF